jgi:TRAP-type C4-dicarboxylate transport system permease large subunit
MGWFTPNGGGGAAVIWSLFLGLVRYRTMTLTTLAKAGFDTIETTASVLFIVTAASVFAWLLTVSQAAQLLSTYPLHHREQVGVPDPGELAGPIQSAASWTLSRRLPFGAHPPAHSFCGLASTPVHFGQILTLQPDDRPLHPPLGMVLFVLSRVARPIFGA